MELLVPSCRTPRATNKPGRPSRLLKLLIAGEKDIRSGNTEGQDELFDRLEKKLKQRKRVRADKKTL